MSYIDPAGTDPATAAKRMSGNGNNEDLRSVIKVIIFLLGQSSKSNSSKHRFACMVKNIRGIAMCAVRSAIFC